MKKFLLTTLILFFPIGEVNANIFDNLRNQGPKKTDIYTYIDKTTKFLNTRWDNDEDLKDVLRPPQILPIAADSKVYGGCGDYSIGSEVGGSAYCPRTHTIFLVPEQLQYFADEFGPSSVAFVVAHEYAHAVQLAFGILGTLKDPALELQADCIAGAFIKDGSSEIGITREDTLDMANLAYAIGDPTHGTGAQRKYALSAGMGVIDYGCTNKEMENLGNNKVDTSIVSTKRSIDSKLNLNITPYPKTIVGSFKVN